VHADDVAGFVQGLHGGIIHPEGAGDAADIETGLGHHVIEDAGEMPGAEDAVADEEEAAVGFGVEEKFREIAGGFELIQATLGEFAHGGFVEGDEEGGVEIVDRCEGLGAELAVNFEAFDVALEYGGIDEPEGGQAKMFEDGDGQIVLAAEGVIEGEADVAIVEAVFEGAVQECVGWENTAAVESLDDLREIIL
jgi:hypothetical protein